jgi:rhomboid family GlyGly-CTERM serine protease
LVAAARGGRDAAYGVLSGGRIIGRFEPPLDYSVGRSAAELERNGNVQLASAKVQIDGPPGVLAGVLGRLLEVRSTIGLTVAMLAANWCMLASIPSGTAKVLALLEYDRAAILHGQIWRLVTGNLVHWSAEHFWLDVGAFLILGLAYEQSFKRSVVSFSAFVLAISLSIGAALFVLLPDMGRYRGLSGVDSGIFAAALLIEAAQAGKDHRRWLYLAPAALVFTAKIVFECWTGELFFGTSSLGDLGQPVPLAHATGALTALPVLLMPNRRIDCMGSGKLHFLNGSSTR